MKNLSLFALSFLFALPVLAASPAGRWKTIDDDTHKPRSIVRIEEKDGKFEGFVDQVFAQPGDTGLCDKCDGDLKGKPVLGMRIMWDLRKDDDVYNGGHIIDPNNGKQYKCKMSLSADGNELTVRGFIGFSLIGRSQKWYREL